jgi:hypothetical protein
MPIATDNTFAMFQQSEFSHERSTSSEAIVGKSAALRSVM